MIIVNKADMSSNERREDSELEEVKQIEKLKSKDCR
jgi:hypothetical protein